MLCQSCPTLTQALLRWGDPRALAADPQAAPVLKSIGGYYLSQEKIERVIAAARSTVGVRMNNWQAREMREVAGAIAARHEEIAA